MEDVKIFEQELFGKDELGKKNKVGRIAIIVGGTQSANPKGVIDEAVQQYVGNKPFCQFTEIHLDNPWVRIVISGINDIQYEPFDTNHHL